MRVEKLNSSHEAQMIELLKSDQKNSEVDYYLDRPSGFWKPYNWYSMNQNFAWGVFEGSELIGMTALTRLPFYFGENKMPVYLNTDYFVNFQYRKTLAAYQLLKQLQESQPEPLMFEIGIENQPGFLDVLPKLSKKYENETIWLPETTLHQYFVSAKIKSSETLTPELQVNDSYAAVELYLNQHKEKNKNSGLIFSEEQWNPAGLPKLQYFEFRNGHEFIRGLFANKTELQKVRWNGQPRLYIEKYKRLLNGKSVSEFQSGDELPFLFLSFVEAEIKTAGFADEFLIAMNNYCEGKNFFCWNIRDFDGFSKSSIRLDRIQFSRRIPITSQSSHELNAAVNLLKHCKPILDSIFV